MIEFVLPYDEPYSAAGGAIATVVAQLTHELRASGVRVGVLTPPLRGPAYAADEVVPTRYGATQPLVRRALGAVRRRVTGTVPDARARYGRDVAGRLQGGHVVVHNDSQLAEQLAAAGHDVTLWVHNLLRGADGAALARSAGRIPIVTVSDYVRRWLIETYDVPPASVTTIHNAVGPTLTPPAAWTRDPATPLRVVIHGRIDPNKGQVLAARAVARARERGAAVQLRIIGGVQTFGLPASTVDAYLRDLDEAVADAGATRTGRIAPADVPGALRDADVALILPTVPDPFPMACLEAIGCGCAVIASPLGGVDELVGEAAIRVDPDVDQVADALIRLADDPELLRRLRAAARERSRDFTWAQSAGQLIDLLDRERVVEG